jgi:hypothetical protein
MKAQTTAGKVHVTERQKAWARLALLTVVGLVCPPLAAAGSGLVWGIYLLLVVLYSLWTVRITRVTSREKQIGYLLCVTDALVLVPLFVWSVGVGMDVVLVLLWLAGATASQRAAIGLRQDARSKIPSRPTTSSRSRSRPNPSQIAGEEAPLERALRVRLKVLEVERTRFGVVLLRIAGHEAMIVDHGKEATREFLQDVGRRGLRLLGPDAQLFQLPGGRMAYVFATDPVCDYSGRPLQIPASQLDAHDVESLAMDLARTTCQRTLGGHGLECVVGWASAPADGTTADDLMYAAESGALSSAAFRRVGGSRIAVPEPEKKRAVAG